MHFKVPGWFSDICGFLFRTLPMFLSRFKDKSGGTENKSLLWKLLRMFLTVNL